FVAALHAMTRLSDIEHDLAEMRGALHELERFLRVREREALVDDGVNIVLLDGARHLLEMRTAADGDAADLEVLRKDRGDVHILGEARKNADHGDVAADARRHDGTRESVRPADF